MDLLLTLATPIDQQLRPQFLQEVAQELEAADKPAALARCIGLGARFRDAFGIRRRWSRLAESKLPALLSMARLLSISVIVRRAVGRSPLCDGPLHPGMFGGVRPFGRGVR